MGRIDRALRKSREQAGGKSSLEDTDKFRAPFAEPSQIIDFAELTVGVPDEESLQKFRVVAALEDAPERTAYKVLRTRIIHRLRASQFNVIGVTGAGPGEGKTLTAINLAYSLAQDVNHKVILIDLDLRRPSVHEYLGISPKFDLADVLNSSKTLKEVLVCADANRLAVLTNQTVQKESSEILSSPEMAALIGELRGLGKKVITVIDLPPVLASDDVIAISPLVDSLLLVVGQGRCRRNDLKATQELLKDAEVLGVVLNRSRERSASTGYYDYY